MEKQNVFSYAFRANSLIAESGSSSTGALAGKRLTPLEGKQGKGKKEEDVATSGTGTSGGKITKTSTKKAAEKKKAEHKALEKKAAADAVTFETIMGDRLAAYNKLRRDFSDQRYRYRRGLAEVAAAEKNVELRRTMEETNLLRLSNLKDKRAEVLRFFLAEERLLDDAIATHLKATLALYLASGGVVSDEVRLERVAHLRLQERKLDWVRQKTLEFERETDTNEKLATEKPKKEKKVIVIEDENGDGGEMVVIVEEEQESTTATTTTTTTTTTIESSEEEQPQMEVRPIDPRLVDRYFDVENFDEADYEDEDSWPSAVVFYPDGNYDVLIHGVKEAMLLAEGFRRSRPELTEEEEEEEGDVEEGMRVYVEGPPHTLSQESANDSDGERRRKQRLQTLRKWFYLDAQGDIGSGRIVVVEWQESESGSLMENAEDWAMNPGDLATRLEAYAAVVESDSGGIVGPKTSLHPSERKEAAVGEIEEEEEGEEEESESEEEDEEETSIVVEEQSQRKQYDTLEAFKQRDKQRGVRVWRALILRQDGGYAIKYEKLDKKPRDLDDATLIPGATRVAFVEPLDTAATGESNPWLAFLPSCGVAVGETQRADSDYVLFGLDTRTGQLRDIDWKCVEMALEFTDDPNAFLVAHPRPGRSVQVILLLPDGGLRRADMNTASIEVYFSSTTSYASKKPGLRFVTPEPSYIQSGMAAAPNDWIAKLRAYGWIAPGGNPVSSNIAVVQLAPDQGNDITDVPQKLYDELELLSIMG